MAIDPALNSLISQFGAMGQSTSPDMNKMVALENQIVAKMQADMQAAEHQVPVYQPPTQSFTNAQGVQQSFQPFAADPNAVFQTDMQAELHGASYAPYTNPNPGLGFQLPTVPTPTISYTLAPPAHPVQGRLMQSGVNSDQALIDASNRAVVQASISFSYNDSPASAAWVAESSSQAQADLINLENEGRRGPRRATGEFAAELASKWAQDGVARDSNPNGTDFVSSCLADSGLYHKSPGDSNVETFRNNLVAQGYHGVPPSKAQSGDVAVLIGDGAPQQTFIVASSDGSGATRFVGPQGELNAPDASHNPWPGYVVEYFHREPTAV